MEILYQDHDFIAVNKPSGLLSIPDGYQLSLPTIRSTLEPEFGRLWVVHRLDKETSGVLLLARNTTAHKVLNTLFEERKITKEYRAFVHGEFPQGDVSIDFPLRKNGDREHRTVVDPAVGKHARTIVKTLSSGAVLSLVAAFPKTGYTHQIRAHLCAFGFPIVGDTLYRCKSTDKIKLANPLIQRVALHAYEISFLHPVSNLTITVNAPYPPDFKSLIEDFKNQNPG